MPYSSTAGEVVISMCPAVVFANSPPRETGQLRDQLHGPWRQQLRAVMVLLYGARYSLHDNPVERIWGGLKNYLANTAVTWPGRLRQVRSFFRARSPDQLLGAAAPWTSPWLPPGYEENFWNAA